jgi:hypothetical protein
MTYRARKRLAILILVVGMPAWIVLATTLVGWIERPSILVELAVYVGLGMVWILPLRSVFRGIGQPDPDAPKE